MPRLSRRKAIIGLVATTGILALSRSANATVDGTAKVLGELIGGKSVLPGKIKLDIPQIAENGNSVPVSVDVESPMTEQAYVRAVHLLAEGNPEAVVASFMFTPMSGKASVSTRMRLAQTQKIIALAEMSDGTFHMEKAEVKVTIGGCGG